MVAADGVLVTRVLVVGAGPTGLALALQAHALGAAARVIDRRVAYPNSRMSIDGLPEANPCRVGDRLPDLPVTVADGCTRLQTLTARPGTHLLLLRDAPTVVCLCAGSVRRPPENADVVHKAGFQVRAAGWSAMVSRAFPRGGSRLRWGRR